MISRYLNIENSKLRLLVLCSFRRVYFLGAILSSMMLMSGSIQAHRQKTVLTTIQCNQRSELLEIVHRTFAHDVEHTLGNYLQTQGGLDNLEAQAQISVELSNSFMLWDSTGEKIPLSLIGAELEAEYLYIYQEAPCAALGKITSVRHEMLRNYWPDMTNFLNLYDASGTRSLIFTGDSGIQSLE